MLRTPDAKKMMMRLIITIFLSFSATLGLGQAQEATLNFVPAQTTINFTLGDVLHTVHGSFNLKSGQIRFIPANNSISGEIVVDATSGNSGSGARDRKMHKDILESARYHEVTFLADRVEGKVLTVGTSTVQVHGMFGIHGAEHEVTVPAQIEFAPDHWSLTANFTVPYVTWGMKDPSTFILRVEKTVTIDLRAQGANPWASQR